MPTRRPVGSRETPADIVRHNRLLETVGEMGRSITDRLEEVVDTMNARLDRIETAVRQGEEGRKTIMTEVGELRHEQGDLRDLVNRSRERIEGHLDEQTETRAPAMTHAAKAAIEQSIIPAIRSEARWAAV